MPSTTGRQAVSEIEIDWTRLNVLAIDPRPLSGREAEILAAAIEGLTDDQIAYRLGVRASTVNSHWTRIRGKLGLRTRTELVVGVLMHEFQRRLHALRETAQATG